MSCRFPGGVDAPEAYWRFLLDGGCGVGEVPPPRWEECLPPSPRNSSLLRAVVRRAACLDDVEGFDAAFFGISPREASVVDPQQRLSLELAWEALEHAGVPVDRLAGTDSGVFMAATSFDYGQRLMTELALAEAWAVNGGMLFGIANRISYLLDLRGPSMAVDTACAGSLTAVHLACQSLRAGEVPLAIAGGVNVIATPGMAVSLNAAGALAPDGRSKTFDASADGYGRGEGAGVVVLKRLSDALRDGDRVLALIRGSGAFQDGRSDGMMAPNGAAQEHMFRQIYRRAGISPSDVDYIEAHGTGTPVGDRIEIEALAKVFGAGRPADRPCLVGSVKPNIGHLEAGAGIAGLIKTVLALRHGIIPPSLHRELTSVVDWREARLRVVADVEEWPGSRRRLAAVSNYGVGGSVAHVVLEQGPQDPPSPCPAEGTGRPMVYPLSARSGEGVRAAAGRLAAWLSRNPEVAPASVGHTLACRRAHLSHRAAVVAEEGNGLVRRLEELAAADDEQIQANWRPDEAPVWVFSGHGAQWDGMGRDLLESAPEFARTIDDLEPVYRTELGVSPREAIETGDWSRTWLVQAMLFPLQLGIAEVWRDLGVRPAAVVGHSVGEITAAVVAGALDQQEGAVLACRRALQVKRVSGAGGMAMVGLGFTETGERLDGIAGVTAAIEASPSWTVISGEAGQVTAVADRLRREGVAVRRIETDVAFHSSQMDPAVARLVDRAAPCPLVPHTALYSTALPDPRTAAPRDIDYWAANLRGRVRFAQAIRAAIDDGHRVFLEISAHPIVGFSIEDVLSQADEAEGVVLHSLRRQSPAMPTLMENLAALHAGGGEVDWAKSWPPAPLADLPTMAWQRQPYWLPRPASSVHGQGHDPQSHTLLGAETIVNGTPPARLWHTHLDDDSRPYPGRHLVHETDIVPAAVLLSTFAAAAGQPGRIALDDVCFSLPVKTATPQEIQVVAQDGRVRLAGRENTDEPGPWQVSASATIAAPEPVISEPGGTTQWDAAATRSRCPAELPWEELHERHARSGLTSYGFRWRMRRIHAGEREVVGQVAVEPGQGAGRWAPALDAALSLLQPLFPDGGLHVIASIAGVRLAEAPPDRLTVHARRNDDTVEVALVDDAGAVIGTLSGIRLSAVGEPSRTQIPPDELAQEMTWRPYAIPREPSLAVHKVVLVGERDQLLDRIAAHLERAGTDCQIVTELAAPPEPGTAVVIAPSASDQAHPVQAAQDYVGTLVETAQSLTRHSADQVRLWCLTRDVRDCTTPAAVPYASLWGAARIIGGEAPDLWGGLIDLPQHPDDPALDQLPTLLGTPTAEDVVSLTGDGPATLRYTHVRSERAERVRCRPDASYLITGGLGDLGLASARWLVDNGARRLVLVGRDGLPSRDRWAHAGDPRLRRRIDAVRALEATGATVRVLGIDLAHPAAPAALRPENLDLPPIRGVIHAAGAVSDHRLETTTRSSVEQAMRPKAEVLMALDQIFPPGSLDFFALFSSCGQLARVPGQIAYAAANSFLDGFAAHRHAAGDPAVLSLAWMTWRDMGMAKSATVSTMEAESRGLGALSADEAFAAWKAADRSGHARVALFRPIPVEGTYPSLTEVIQPPQEPEAQTPAFDPADTNTSSWAEQLTRDLTDQIAAELKLTPDTLDTRRPLTQYGMDSVMAVSLRQRLRRRYRLELPQTLLWNEPTVTALAERLQTLIQETRQDQPQAEPLTSKA